MKAENIALGILVLLIIGSIFISGCVQEPEAPPIEPPPTQPEPTGLQECPFECCPGVEYVRRDCPSPELVCQDNECVLPGGYTEQPLLPADLTQLTFFEGEGMTADPDWNPDGSRIVFGRDTDDERGLYIINSDGTGLTKIGPGDVFDPSWSPVDNRILCYGGENSELYMIDLDEDDTEKIALAEHAMYPAWSPDGKKIVYFVYDDSKAPIPYNNPQCDGTGVSISIWIMNSDGTGKTQLTTDEDGQCSDPSFSPDGSKILYNKGFIHPGVPFLVRSESEIWVMNSDGSDKHAIYAPRDSKYYLHQRSWSKNNEIIFEKLQWQKAPQIWVMNADGTNPRPVLVPEESMDATLYGDIAWDNTGTKIVTTKWRSASEETPDIFVNSNVVTFSLQG